jgi:hypothetical protein
MGKLLNTLRLLLCSALVTSVASVTNSLAEPIAPWVNPERVPGFRSGWEERTTASFIPDASSWSVPLYPGLEIFYATEEPTSAATLGSVLFLSEDDPSVVVGWYQDALLDYCIQRIQRSIPVIAVFALSCQTGLSEATESAMLATEIPHVVVKAIPESARSAFGGYRTYVEVVYRPDEKL